jgi:ABC-type polysaccharide/polyol phosphate export permease
MADGRLEVLRAVDPMNLVVRDFRDVLYTGTVHADHLAVTALVCAAGFAAAMWVFRRLAADLAMAV